MATPLTITEVAPLRAALTPLLESNSRRVRQSTDLEVIIPAYNESARLPRTLSRTVEFLASQPWNSSIVVVDNGSSDDTAAMASRVGETAPVCVYVIGCARPGKGAAVRRGLLSSTSRFVGFIDADMATPIATLAVAVDELQQGASAVIASRHIPGARFARPQPWGRRAGGAAFRHLSRDLVEGVRDTQCGFKFFDREAAVRALVRCRLSGFAFDVELLRHLQQAGGRIVEVPVTWTDDARSTFSPLRDGVPTFGSILRMQKALSR